MASANSSSVTWNPVSTGSVCCISFPSMPTTPFFSGRIRALKKPPSPSPLTNPRGEGKAKAVVLGVRAGEQPGRNRTQKKKGHPWDFCDSRSMAGAKVAPQGWPWRKGNFSWASGRTPETLHRPKSWATGLLGWFYLFGFASELPEGATTKIHCEGYRESPIPEGTFPNGKPRRFCHVTPKFAGGEKCLLRTRTPHPFIGDRPGPLLAGAQAGSRLCGRANPKSPTRLSAPNFHPPEG